MSLQISYFYRSARHQTCKTTPTPHTVLYKFVSTHCFHFYITKVEMFLSCCLSFNVVTKEKYPDNLSFKNIRNLFSSLNVSKNNPSTCRHFECQCHVVLCHAHTPTAYSANITFTSITDAVLCLYSTWKQDMFFFSVQDGKKKKKFHPLFTINL